MTETQTAKSWAKLERFGIIGTPGLNRLRFVDGRDQLISGPAAICDSPETADEIARRWNGWGKKCEVASVLRVHLIDAVQMLEQAAARVEIANKEGNPILSAWLSDAKRLLESVINDPRLV